MEYVTPRLFSNKPGIEYISELKPLKSYTGIRQRSVIELYF